MRSKDEKIFRMMIEEHLLKFTATCSVSFIGIKGPEESKASNR